MPKARILRVEEFGSRHQFSEQFLKKCNAEVVENLIKMNLQNSAVIQNYKIISEITVTWDSTSFKYSPHYDFAIPCEATDEGAWRYVYARAEVIKDA